MPNRIIKESIWSSSTLSKISLEAASHFLWLLPLPDDHGCCLISTDFICSRLYYKRKHVTSKKVAEWNAELERVDLIRTWEVDGERYAYFPKWGKHQVIRSLHFRKTPIPPESVINCNQLQSIAISCGDHLNLNPNLNPIYVDLRKSTHSPTNVEKDNLTDMARYWNENCGKLPLVSRITASRRSKELKRLDEFGEEKFKQAIKLAAASVFCNGGKNGDGWKANYDFLIANENNIAKLLEGKYGGEIKQKIQFKLVEPENAEDKLHEDSF